MCIVYHSPQRQCTYCNRGVKDGKIKLKAFCVEIIIKCHVDCRNYIPGFTSFFSVQLG